MNEVTHYLGSFYNAAKYPEATTCLQKIRASRSKDAKSGDHRHTWTINCRYEGDELVAYLCVQSISSVGNIGRYEVKMNKVPSEIRQKKRRPLKQLKRDHFGHRCEACGQLKP